MGEIGFWGLLALRTPLIVSCLPSFTSPLSVTMEGFLGQSLYKERIGEGICLPPFSFGRSIGFTLVPSPYETLQGSVNRLDNHNQY